ncbi:hypothetical protein ARMSODRAFT_496247 [Armillaria solidipes]|uniref:Borealin N-terminal domain-containing protein n=1 Tax=Armillaria solidipes TaxID=1076256 RepID=A0A2H3CHY0_9AGAR|nr:hypothetical protein ARMSODRAFT_496247 [Armillaria solidipes]
MEFPTMTRKYSDEEKSQLIANLNLEVAHRTRQLRSWLAGGLENFKIHQEGHVSRIPKQVRGMTMREFGEKYNGNVQAALRGVQREKLASAGNDPAIGEIDKNMRKRKWLTSQDQEATADPSEPRALKNARLESPQRKPGSSTGPGTAQRARLLSGVVKTPGKGRPLPRVPQSPSPQKSRPPFNAGPGAAFQSKLPSPSKPKSNNPLTRSRVPSLSTFNPTLPPKTPGYPGSKPPNSNVIRMPRRDESMLSVNGSPLANPFEFGMKWAKGANGSSEEIAPDASRPALKRTKSNITISRDPSFNTNSLHSRSRSQSNLRPSSSQPSSTTLSRTNSDATLPLSQPSPSHNLFTPTRLQPTPFPKDLDPPPFQLPTLTRSYSVTISTKDGHLLEFDPLQASPGSLDALEGISSSAKKQAREEMGRLVQAAVDKWKIR